MKLDEIIAGIPKIPAERYRAARQHWDTLAKPLGSLGVLEENVTKIAALSGKRQLSRRRRLLYYNGRKARKARHVFFKFFPVFFKDLYALRI